MSVIIAGCAGLAALAVNSAVDVAFWGVFAAVTAAFIVEAATDLALAGVTPAIRGTGSWTETARTVGTAQLSSIPLQVPLVALLAYSYETISPWSVALFAIPAFAAHRLLLLYRQQIDTASALGEANARLAGANLSFATALVATLDARDRYTAGHSAAVAIYAGDIADRMNLSDDEQKLVRLCGLVHDIGKIGLPAGLLEKPGALTLDERKQMELHSTIGERILRNVEDYSEIAAIVRHHHERVDGNGYPDGLVGDDIPLLARIIAVADAYIARIVTQCRAGLPDSGSPRQSRVSLTLPLSLPSRQSSPAQTRHTEEAPARTSSLKESAPFRRRRVIRLCPRL